MRTADSCVGCLRPGCLKPASRLPQIHPALLFLAIPGVGVGFLRRRLKHAALQGPRVREAVRLASPPPGSPKLQLSLLHATNSQGQRLLGLSLASASGVRGALVSAHLLESVFT